LLPRNRIDAPAERSQRRVSQLIVYDITGRILEGEKGAASHVSLARFSETLPASLDETAARLAAQHIELEGVREDAQHLEPLAAVGRLAFAVSDDIQTCLTSAEACIRRLLGQNTCDDTQRADLEVLRRDLSQAARLLRQAARVGAKP
jgi:hypothetical protein